MNRLLIFLSVCALAWGCEKEQDLSTSVELLSAIVNSSGDTAWQLTYDDNCRLVELDIRQSPAADLAPRVYQNPLDFARERKIKFAYQNSQLSVITLLDSVRGFLRERTYRVTAIGSTVVSLTPGATLVNGAPSTASEPVLTYLYDDQNRLDSVSFSSGVSINYSYDGLGDLVRANYRGGAGKLTTEFYGFSSSTRSPFADLPLKYIMTYAAYVAPNAIDIASFDLRQYEYELLGTQVDQITDATFNDSTAISAYRYETVICK